MKPHLVPLSKLNTTSPDDRPVIGDVLSGYWYSLSDKDRLSAVTARPDLWAEVMGHIPAKVCGHMLPKWLFQRLCQQHGLNGNIVVIERGDTIHIVRGA